MTNKEAIEIIKAQIELPCGIKPNLNEALEIAIKVLEEYPTDKEIQDDMRRTYLGGKK